MLAANEHLVKHLQPRYLQSGFVGTKNQSGLVGFCDRGQPRSRSSVHLSCHVLQRTPQKTSEETEPLSKQTTEADDEKPKYNSKRLDKAEVSIGFAILLAVCPGSDVTKELRAEVVVVPNSLTAVDGNESRETGGNPGDPVRFMQIYDASQFAGSGPVRITQFAHRPDAQPGAASPRFGTLQVFASNIGWDNTLVFSGTRAAQTANLTGPGNTKQFDLLFPFTTPFLYDPSAGNLLIDVRYSSSSGANNLVRDTEFGDPNVGFIFFVGSATAQTGQREAPFVTQFTFEAAPLFTKVTTGPWSDVGTSHGAFWGDYDNDGFIDLFLPQTEGDVGPAKHWLYHNNADGTFSRVTNGPVATVISAGFAASWGDYDNDGHLDLVLLNQDQPNYLFHNRGDGSFAAVPGAAFVSESTSCRGASWVDYDNDGYLDLFRTALNQSSRLYHNSHDGTFTRILQGAFLTAPGYFLGVAWGDYNNDGRLDLFLPQAYEPEVQPSRLYRNDGSGSLTRVGTGTLDANLGSHGAAWGDYDNDGDLDLFVANGTYPDIQSRPNFLYRNDGNDAFTSITSLSAADSENNGGASAVCTWADYDNDGWLDLFVGNRDGQNNFLYHNNGDGTFAKVSSIVAGDGGNAVGATWGDYDNDGFVDLVVANGGEANFLYHNSGNGNHWLKFHLIGTRSNRAAIGAKVRVRATIKGRTFWQMREVPGGDGRGQNSLHVQVGLGDATSAESVRIEWPSGTVQEMSNVPAGQFLSVTEPGGEPQLAATRENGQEQLMLTGKQGSRYAIETATALPTWASADLTVTVTNQSGTVTFPAPGATGDARHFYRGMLR